MPAALTVHRPLRRPRQRGTQAVASAEEPPVVSARRESYHFPNCPGKGCDCRERVRRMLDALDLPNCQCPLTWACTEVEIIVGCDWTGPITETEKRWTLQQCEHVLAAWPHTLSVKDWATLLLMLQPAGYAEPKKLPAPALVLRREARVAIYTERAACKQQLYHPADLWRRQPANDDIHAGPVAENEANGAPVVHQRLGNEKRAE